MPGTGDVIYVLGPSLVALVLGLVILVVLRALRRGPAVAARSAPDHGMQQPAAQSSDSADPKRTVPRQRRADIQGTVARTGDVRSAVRPWEAERVRPVARRMLSRR